MRRRHCFHLIVASICQSTSIGVPSIVQHAIYRCNRSIIELRRAITFTTWAFTTYLGLSSSWIMKKKNALKAFSINDILN